MAVVYSYARLVVAGWLVMAGVAAQFSPSAAAVERGTRWREIELRSVPAEKRDQWIQDADKESAKGEAYFRIFGVLLGGIGIGAALYEAAFLFGRYAKK